MDQNPKQLIAEKLRNSGSFLITVSKNPSVDQLSSALGLSMMLAALNKHATTVFSGEIPNTMEFLEPEKLIDSSVDSLRDFIISISKDKADKLRYKVEDDVVKIYITPYKGKIDENDLKFSQGDLMVDAVIALGVMKRDELDSAISNHGKILHDAAILTITAGKKESSLGSVNWNDENASSISEMLVSISEALQGNLLDAQMATAFLTGIVSATDRFSNKKTSPKVMTMAAQLMAAGANQQLIATNLELDHIDHGVPAHENESVDIHEDEKSDDDDSKKDTESNGKPQQESEDQEGGDDIAGDLKQEVASDASLSLKEIENKLHAHEDELSKHDSMPIDKNLQPPAAQHHEDPAIEALEDEIDHDPVENLRNIEESIHPGQTSFRTAATPPPQPVAPPQNAQQTPPTFQMQQNQSPQQPQEQFQGQPQQQPFPEQTQPSTQAPQQQFPQPIQSMNIPQSAPPSQYPQSMQQEQEEQPAPPPQPQPETRQRVEEPPQAMQQEQQGGRQITGMQQAHDPLATRQPQRIFGTDDTDEPALQYDNQNMEPLTHGNRQIGGVKGQGPKQTFDAPALGGTFNATSDEAQKESEKQMNGDINNELLSHRRAQQAEEQPADMLSQARQEVEQAVQSSPSPVDGAPISIQPQAVPGATQGPGEIAIDERGTFNLNAPQPPSAPPPLPPNPQMNSPQPQANQPPPPPTSPMTPPPPGNVGQMYIPPQQPNSRPNEAQENPFNL